MRWHPQCLFVLLVVPGTAGARLVPGDGAEHYQAQRSVQQGDLHAVREHRAQPHGAVGDHAGSRQADRIRRGPQTGGTAGTQGEAVLFFEDIVHLPLLCCPLGMELLRELRADYFFNDCLGILFCTIVAAFGNQMFAVYSNSFFLMQERFLAKNLCKGHVGGCSFWQESWEAAGTCG